MSSYDQWLEAPYQDMMEESDRFYDWAEEEGYDLENPEELARAESDYEDFIEASYENEAEAKYEAHLDRLEMEAEEREYDEGW